MYGTTALAVPLSLGVTARATPPGPCEPGRPGPARRPHPADRLWRAFDPWPPTRLGGRRCRVSLKSTLPISMGLGSSAALAVALPGVLLRAASGRPASRGKLLALAPAPWKSASTGRPPAWTTPAARSAAPIRFRRRGAGGTAAGAQAVSLRRPLELLVALAGTRRPTQDTVAACGSARRAGPRATRRLFREMGRVAEEGVVAAEAGDLEALGDAMNVNHGLLAAPRGQLARLGRHGRLSPSKLARWGRS